MIHARIAIGCVIAAVCMASASLAASNTPELPEGEFRAVWITRYEWPNADAEACRSRIDEMMRTLAEHRFNAVIFQVRGQCDTLYPSPEEPWSPLIAPEGNDPGWDPLAHAIEAAHDNGLEFHAYINTHVAWQSADHQPPADASHVFHRHFNAADPATCDWLVHDALGKPVQYAADNYVWIAPGVPAAQAYTRRQIMHVVQNYDVDGVHFDRIRTPGPEYSHDPISTDRQAAGSEANPADLDFSAWMCDQFTRFLRDVYAQVAEVKPHVKVSSAPLGLVSRDRYHGYSEHFHYGLTKCYQDAQAWLAAGVMDFVCPQIYWSDSDDRRPDFSDVLTDWIAYDAGRHIYVGQSATVGVDELTRQVGVTRAMKGHGNVVFSYGGFKKRSGFAAYSRQGGVYERPAATPYMPWKNAPDHGIIVGTVTDAKTGEPITDAQVRRNGSDYVALSSADGIYSFVRVPPGEYEITAHKRGQPGRQLVAVTVEAGAVARCDLPLGETPAVAAADAETASPSIAERGDAWGGASTDASNEVSAPSGMTRAGGVKRIPLIFGMIGIVLLVAGGVVAAWLIVRYLRRS